MLPPATLLASSAFQWFAVSATLKKVRFYVLSIFHTICCEKKTAAVVEKFWLTGKICIRFAGPLSKYSLKKSAPDLRLGLIFFAFHYLLYELLLFWPQIFACAVNAIRFAR
jgi:hypothetical protein